MIMQTLPLYGLVFLLKFAITAGKFAITKYANKAGSNGTSLPMSWYLQRAKKGSKKFRKLIEKILMWKTLCLIYELLTPFFS
jgi:hypothetical protein